MVAILDESQHDIILREPGDQIDGMLSRHIRVFHALQDANGAPGFDQPAE